MNGLGTAAISDLFASCRQALRSGDHLRGVDLAQRLVDAVGADPGTLAHALGLLASHRLRLGETEAAGTAALQAVELFTVEGDLAGEAEALCTLVMVYDHLGVHHEGLSCALRAVDAARASGDPRIEALSLNRLGVVSEQLGDLTRAIELMEESLVLLGQVDGDAIDETFTTTNNLGYLLGRRAAACSEAGDRDGLLATAAEAMRVLDEAIEMARAMGNEQREAYALSNVADLKIVLGDDAAARALITRYAAMARRSDTRPLLAFAALDEARLSSARQQHAEVVAQLSSTDHVALQQHHPDVERRSERMLAHSYQALGHFDKAFHHLERHAVLERAALLQRSRAQASMLSTRLELHRARAATEHAELEGEMHRMRADRLAVALDEKAALLSAVSHDLSSPIAAIKMWSYLLHERHGSLESEQRHEIARKISREAHRTGQMLRDLASADRLIRHAVDVRRERVSLTTLIDGVLGHVDSFTHHIVRDHIDPQLVARGDAGLLDRVLDNLVSNALKYTPSGCTIRIGARRVGDDVHLVVTDDGPGLPTALRELVFEAYLRGPTSESTSGSGIGLFLVRTFVEAMGGRVWCEPATPTGLRFLVGLPASD